jgi:hypothetical protein
VIVTIGLFFVMSGGALAATHHLVIITSLKQISPSVRKQLQKEGPAGKEGAAGREGKPGVNGVNGANGGGGESVTSAEVKAGEQGCKLGGSKFTVGGKETFACNGEKGEKGKAGESVTITSNPASCKEGGAEFKVGSGTPTYACNGEKGVIHPGETLAPGATETGVWAFSVNTTLRQNLLPISFPIPLAASVRSVECLHNPPGPECHVFVVKPEETGTGECEGGTVEKPIAKPGNLCIYQGTEDENVNDEFGFRNPGGSQSIGTSGIVLSITTTSPEGGEATGTWAVTAPNG